MTLPTKLTDEEKFLLDRFALLKKKRKELHLKHLASAESQKPVAPKRVVERPQVKIPVPSAKKSPADEANQRPTESAEERKEFKRANSIVKRKPREGADSLGDNQCPSSRIPDPQDYSRMPPSYYDDQDRRPDNDRRRGNTLFVGGYGVDEAVLKKAFEKYGPITRLYMDALRGNGFVTLLSPDAAEQAVAEMHGEMVQGVTLRVSMARRQNYGEGRGNQSHFSDRRGPRPQHAPQPVERVPQQPLLPPDAATKPDRDLVKYNDDFDF